MELFYYQSRLGNFGDDLNAWLWNELAPGLFSGGPDALFCGIGTIIGNPMPPSKTVVVFSSGAGYSPPPSDLHSSKWDVVAVRGPLTAAALNLPERAAVADGALLLGALPAYAPAPEADRRGTIFVPHHQSAHLDWRTPTEAAGVEVLDPRQDSRDVLQRIRSAKLVLAESMHAAIVADVFRVPWVPVFTTRQVNSFKWLDWARSLNVAYRPAHLPRPTVSGAYDDWVESLYTKTWRGDAADDRAALDQFNQLARMQTGPSAARRRRWVRFFFQRIPARAGRSLPAGALSHFDRRRMSATVDRLRQLARSEGALSPERTLRERTEELQERLHKVARRYAA